jgi:hypothetical protein
VTGSSFIDQESFQIYVVVVVVVIAASYSFRVARESDRAIASEIRSNQSCVSHSWESD